jgi:hypothetical protein
VLSIGSRSRCFRAAVETRSRRYPDRPRCRELGGGDGEGHGVETLGHGGGGSASVRRRRVRRRRAATGSGSSYSGRSACGRQRPGRFLGRRWRALGPRAGDLGGRLAAVLFLGRTLSATAVEPGTAFPFARTEVPQAYGQGRHPTFDIPGRGGGAGRARLRGVVAGGEHRVHGRGCAAEGHAAVTHWGSTRPDAGRRSSAWSRRPTAVRSGKIRHPHGGFRHSQSRNMLVAGS